MRIARIIAILLVTVLLALTACTSPTTTLTTTPNLAVLVESNVVEAGSSFIVTGTSFQPRQWVFADFKYQATNRGESVNVLGKADEQGSVYLTIKVPVDTISGDYEVTISTGSSEKIENRQLLTTIPVQVKAKGK